MKIIKMATALASSMLIALFVLIITVKNPELALYEETIDMLMQEEGAYSEQEIKERFPILRDIQSNMDQIAQLNQLVLSKTQSPAPVLNEEEVRELEECRQKISQLRQNIRTELHQLMAIYAKDQP